MNQKQTRYLLWFIATIVFAVLIDSRTDALSRAAVHTTDAIHHVYTVWNYESQNIQADGGNIDGEQSIGSTRETEQFNTLQSSANRARKNQLTDGEPHVPDEPREQELAPERSYAFSEQAALPEQKYIIDDLAQCDLALLKGFQQVGWQKQLSALDSEFKRFEIPINQYLHVTLYAKNMSQYFRQHFSKRLHQIHLLYFWFLKQKAAQKINLRMVILPDRYNYELYTSIEGHDPAFSQGVYFHGTDSAFIEYKGDEQTLEITLHEAVHGLNAHLIGQMPRAINEGLAENFEGIIGDGKDYKLDFKHGELQKEFFDLYALLSSEYQWQTEAMSKLYLSGKIWMAFFLGSEDGISFLSEMFSNERIDPCNSLPSDDIILLLDEHKPRFEAEFKHWLWRNQRN